MSEDEYEQPEGPYERLYKIHKEKELKRKEYEKIKAL